MTEYIMKIKVLDENDGFLEDLEKSGHVMMFFADGGAARVEKPDWEEIEDQIRERKRRHEHPDDCGCGKCSGENRAIEAMERGIVASERARIGDD